MIGYVGLGDAGSGDVEGFVVYLGDVGGFPVAFGDVGGLVVYC